ncbi:MAG: hypothetical protein IJL22_00670 [Bacteroidales bacterium]|nr:hypothetical protein [Bacteroidales bacterium]
MDISLLSKMIGELLLDHEEVGLPGLGAFLAEMVPASFSDKGYTINPPYRRVTFIPSRSEDDSLVTLYSQSNGIDYDQAKAIIQHFLEETKKELLEKKMVVFPGLGRLRSTRQNNFFFITDEDLDIFPDGFGLPPVSLKNHVETKEEVQEKVEELVTLVEAPVAEVAAAIPAEAPLPAEEPAPAPEESPLLELAEPAASEGTASETHATLGTVRGGTVSEANGGVERSETVSEAAPSGRRMPGWLKTTLIIILILVALAAVALATFVILAQAAPDFIDSILYTPEELRIINYQ